jgi:hypothetical protein
VYIVWLQRKSAASAMCIFCAQGRGH